MKSRTVQGFTLIELLIVIAIVSIIAAIAVPGLLRARISGNEASALGSLRAVGSAEASYHSLNNGYADDLSKLAETCLQLTVAFVGPDLNENDVQKNGYRFRVDVADGAEPGPNDVCGRATVTGFYGTARPILDRMTGNRGFAVNTAMAIWQNFGGPEPPSQEQMAQPPTATVSPLGH